MTDLTKNKIAFAVGLLAVLFALTPLINSLDGAAFLFFGITLRIKYLYWLLSSLLGLSVYCYSFQFILPRHRLPTILGDTFYVIGLIAPLFYVALFLITVLIGLLTPLLLNEHVLSVLQSSLGFAAGIGAAILSNMARRVLDSKQRQAEKQQSSTQEASLLLKANALIKDGHFDLSVIEAFRALEVAARERYGVVGNGRQRLQWFSRLAKDLPNDLREPLERSREARNNAAHAVEPITESSAKEALSIIGKVIALLADTSTDQCPKCGSHSLTEESGVDSGFHWTRKRCIRCGYLDLS